MRFSRWMKSGALSRRKSKHGGCGRPCVVEHGRSWQLSEVIGAQLPAFASGRRFLRNRNPAVPSAIFGQPLDTFSRRKAIAVLAKKLGRRHICNAGTSRCASGLHVTCDRRSPFPASEKAHHFATQAFIVQYNTGISLPP